MTADGGPRPAISAVIPAYNREQTVVRSIESVLGQSVPPDEIIVVDDGSADATADRAAAVDERVTVIRQENGGAGAARNRGVESAAGEWIAFLDSDDVWLPEHLERVHAAMAATDAGADTYFANTQRPPDEGGKLQWELAGYECGGSHEMRADGREWALAPRQPLMLQATVFRRAAYLEAGGIWPALRAREDTHLFLKLLPGRATCAVNFVGTEMTSDDTSGERLSVKFQQSGKHLEQTVMVYDDILSRGQWSGPERKELANRLAAGHLGLGRRALAAKNPWAAMTHVSRAFFTSPSRFFAAAGRRLGGSSPKGAASPETRVS